MQITESILKGCKENNRRAQKELYTIVAPKLFGLCLRYTASKQEAEDYLQEGFIRVFSHIKDFKGDGNFEGWCRRVVVNVILTDLRKKNALKGSFDIDDWENIDKTVEDTISEINKNELLHFVRLLPEGKRVVFNLYAIEGFNHKEIGEQLGISEGTSKSQLAKAREMLRDIHKKYNRLSTERIH